MQRHDYQPSSTILKTKNVLVVIRRLSLLVSIMADGEKTPSENFRKKHSCLSDAEDSDNEEPSVLGIGAGHAKNRERPTNHFNIGASGA